MNPLKNQPYLTCPKCNQTRPNRCFGIIYQEGLGLTVRGGVCGYCWSVLARIDEAIGRVQRARKKLDPKERERKLSKIAEGAKRRNDRIARATPPWADKRAIQRVYELAKRESRLTGIPHHVDHIVPITSDIVCGLHVVSNLRVVYARVNLRKSNRFFNSK